jgi:hypothetical protein
MVPVEAGALSKVMFSCYVVIIQQKIKVKVKLFMCIIKHRSMKTCERIEVHSHVFLTMTLN